MHRLEELVPHEYAPRAKGGEPGHGKHDSRHVLTLPWVSNLAELHVMCMRQRKRNASFAGLFHGRKKPKIERIARPTGDGTRQANPDPQIQVDSGSGVTEDRQSAVRVHQRSGVSSSLPT
jgi:hypothetical protein